MGVIDVALLGDFGDTDARTFDQDVARMKAAVLYGDRVDFASPYLATLVAQFLLTVSIPSDRLIGQAADEGFDLAEVQDSIRDSLRRIQANSVPSRTTLFLAGHALKDAVAIGAEPGAPLVGEHLRQLLSLTEHGLVELQVGDVGAFLAGDRDTAEARLQQVLAEFFRLLRYGDAGVYPLLALGSRLALRQSTQRPDVDFTRANRAELATQVIGTLPGLPDATADDLIDLRRILRPHLAVFRAAIADVEQRIEVDVDDPAFDDAVHDYIVSTVQPALADLDQRMRDLDVVSTLSRAAAHKKTAAGVVAVALAPMGSLLAVPQAAAIASGVTTVATAAGVAAAVADEIQHRRALRRETASNPFLLLHRAQGRLVDG